jgi:uncharacterized membrane protein
MYRRLLKALHTLGAIGFMGGLAAILVLVANTAVEPTASFAAVRNGIALINKWLLTPSLLIVLVSGLLAIAATNAYKDAGWAWMKALLGVVTFEGTLITIVGTGRKAAEQATAAAAGQADAMTQVTELLRTEWGAAWMMLFLGLVNIVLAIWRPRFTRRREDESGAASS